MPGYHSLARGNSHASTEMAELPYRSRETIDSTALSKETEPVLDSEIYFPEGGVQGWLVVLGGFCLSIATFGFVVSWGTFQEFYEATLLKNSSSSAIAWIGSIQYSLIFLPGLLAGRLFELGYFQQSLIGASILFIATNFLIAECKQYWQFLLCQGIGIGVASGWIYVPCVGAVSQWFKVKRPLAFMVVSLGVAVGGIIFPITFRNLLPQVGFKWTIRTTAFINSAMFIMANSTMRTRLPSTPSSTNIKGFKAVVTLPYVSYVFSTFFAYLGLYTMLTFLSVSAVRIGFDSSQAFYLVSIANAATAIGRVIGAGGAMKFGAINVMAILTLLAGIITYVWPFVTHHAAFVAITCIYGITSGAYVALFPVGVAQLGNVHDIGKRAGLQMSIMALGALAGPPISGVIIERQGSFKAVGIYAGTMIVVSVILMMFTRYFALKRILGGKI